MDDWADQLIENAPERDVAERVHVALARILREDAPLLRADANERSVSHRLALYLEEQFPDWNVDCEYNRDGHDPKRLHLTPQQVSSDDTRGTTVYPDIIVHKRGKPDNLLVIEIKKSNGGNEERDYQKLRAFRRELNYLCALFVLFGGGSDSVGISRVNWSVE